MIVLKPNFIILDELDSGLDVDSLKIVCDNINDYLKENPVKKGENILVIIGPEGGFSESEFEYFRNKNLPLITLGDLILKAETAVIIGLGNIIYEY